MAWNKSKTWLTMGASFRFRKVFQSSYCLEYLLLLISCIPHELETSLTENSLIVAINKSKRFSVYWKCLKSSICLCTSYCLVPSTIRQIFHEFLMSWNRLESEITKYIILAKMMWGIYAILSLTLARRNISLKIKYHESRK